MSEDEVENRTYLTLDLVEGDAGTGISRICFDDAQLDFDTPMSGLFKVYCNRTKYTLGIFPTKNLFGALWTTKEKAPKSEPVRQMTLNDLIEMEETAAQHAN